MPLCQPKLGGTTDAKPYSVRPIWDERCIFLTLPKEKKMNPTPQPEPQEIHLRDRAVETLTDNSLPAAQVIVDQNDEAELNSAPRFVP